MSLRHSNAEGDYQGLWDSSSGSSSGRWQLLPRSASPSAGSPSSASLLPRSTPPHPRRAGSNHHAAAAPPAALLPRILAMMMLMSLLLAGALFLGAAIIGDGLPDGGAVRSRAGAAAASSRSMLMSALLRDSSSSSGDSVTGSSIRTSSSSGSGSRQPIQVATRTRSTTPQQQPDAAAATGHADATANTTSSDANDAALTSAIALLQRFGVSIAPWQQMMIDKRKLARALADDDAAAPRRARLEASLAANGGVRTRGLLVVAGGADQMANALVLLRVLRQHHNCTLPVEIVYYGDQEFDPVAARAIELYAQDTMHLGDSRLIDGTSITLGEIAYHGAMLPARGFAAKVHALAFVTRFHEVLLLDSDNLPLLPPQRLFESPEWAKHGSMFWPDFWASLWMDADFYSMLDLPVPWHQDRAFQSTESGQVMLDRLRHFEVLDWLWFLNSHHEVTYAAMHGDKDTFRVAFQLAGHLPDFYQVPIPPRDAVNALVVPPASDAAYLASDGSTDAGSDDTSTSTSIPSGSSDEQDEQHGQEQQQQQQQAEEVVEDVGFASQEFHHQGMWQSAPDGRPAFLHRTASNKLFPGCQSHAGLGYCHVAYVTVPLPDDGRMLAAMDAGLLFKSSTADVSMFLLSGTCDAEQQEDPDRPDDPGRCAALHGTSPTAPVPLVPVERFRGAAAALEASYAAAEAVAAALAAGGEAYDPMALWGQEAADDGTPQELRGMLTFGGAAGALPVALEGGGFAGSQEDMMGLLAAARSGQVLEVDESTRGAAAAAATAGTADAGTGDGEGGGLQAAGTEEAVGAIAVAAAAAQAWAS